MPRAIVTIPLSARNVRRVIANAASPHPMNCHPERSEGPAVRCNRHVSHPGSRNGHAKPFSHARSGQIEHSCWLLFTVFGVSFPSDRTQTQRPICSDLGEVEILDDGVGDGIKRTAANAFSTQPVVFDEVN